MQDDEVEPTKLQEVVEVVTTAKLITEVVTVASATITAAAPQLTTAAASQLTTAAALTLTTAPSADRRKKGVDEAYARELEAELNKNIDWDEVIHHVQRKEKEDNAVKRMKYDDIHLIFDKYFNSNVAFLEKTKEQIEEEDSRSLKRISKSKEEKAAKKQKLDEEVAELKRHLQIVPNDDDDVYTEATPLAHKIPVVYYEIYTENNKPYYKIIRSDRSPQLFMSFLSLLRNFDRDLEVLWELVKESSKDTSLSSFTSSLTLLISSSRVNLIFLPVEKMYPLTHFILEQMVKDVRLEVDYESEMSLELLRLVRRQPNKGYVPQ
nr:hypothetical protein [Tanacetum cinerariifolium]